MTKEELTEIIKQKSPEEAADEILKLSFNLLVSGSLLLHDLFAVAAIENEDGRKVIEYIDKPNGGSVAYVRHDAMVKKLNSLNAVQKQ